MKVNVLITGCCGFIGHALCLALLNAKSNLNIYGIDNLNSYYDTSIKKNRLKDLKKNKKIFF
jgi:UDP-glucuronate 4-epimerase